MRLLDLTLTTPELNLALDEALLNEAEAGGDFSNVFRLWESPEPFVIVGRASKVAEEVNLPACQAAGVKVLRRCSGGTAVVAGPGCLMYAIVLGYDEYPELRAVEQAHQFVMGRMRDALARVEPDIQFQGSCDLTLRDRKISGNSLRCKRGHLLYHGTVLYDFPLSQISGWLRSPPREPEYRQGRAHDAFLTNMGSTIDQIKAAIREQWSLADVVSVWPRRTTDDLVTRQYSLSSWNERL